MAGKIFFDGGIFIFINLFPRNQSLVISQMFFYLSKILSFLFTPVFWIFAFLLLSFFSKNSRRKKTYLLVSLFLLYLFSNSFVFETVSRRWELPAMKYEELQQYDAGIVLGGLLTYDVSINRIQFQQGADRLFQAVELYKIGKIKKIFFVGGSGSIEFAHIKEGFIVKRYLLTLGVPEKDIWIENESKNTRENALLAKKFLEKDFSSQGNFLLLTSARHLRRAIACFKKAGFSRITPYSVDRTAGNAQRYALDYLFLPNAEILFRWDGLIHEWLGMLVYKIMGYA